MKKLIYTFLVVSISFSACEKEDAAQSTQSPFEGAWAGEFQGNNNNGDADIGTWFGNISSDGILTGEGLSFIEGELKGTGTVSNSGNLNASFVNLGVTSTGATFEGTIIGDNASGTWENTQYGFVGIWSGSKQ